ncbi:STAS domain-containing protein [Micromonospora sp. CPCC 205556]
MHDEGTWQWRLDGGVHEVALLLSGEIDVAGVARFAEVLREAIDRAPRVRVDLARLSFLDSTVLSALVAAHRDASEAGKRLTVVNPVGHVRRVLDITGLLAALEQEEDIWPSAG